MSVAADKWGFPFFYPTKSTGGLGTGVPFFYQQSDDILDDDNFNGEGDITDSSGGEWTFETEGATSVQIFKNTDTANSIGGCDMDFEETAIRGYGYKADDPRDVEIKFLIKFVDSNSDNGFAIEGPTGRHTSDGCCQGFAYKLDIRYRDNPPKFRFRKEMWHVSNSTDPKTGIWTHPKANFMLLGHNDFVGIGYCHYLKKGGANSGHNTNDSIVLEMWFNPDPLANPDDWTMLKRTEDKGGWGDDGDHCNGDKDQIGVWSNSNLRLKSNDKGGKFILANLSMREIDPTKSFDDNPDQPTEGPQEIQTIQGKFKLQWDLNTNRTSSCAGAGLSKFFSDSPVNDKFVGTVTGRTTRVAEACKNSSSAMSGKLLKQLDVPLKKEGSPTTPNISAKIWSSGGSVVYTSPTTIDPSTLTTSYTTQTFDFSTNTRVFVIGDRVGIEWTGNSDTNYVICGYEDGGPINETYYHYADSLGPAWSEKIERDFACDMWQ